MNFTIQSISLTFKISILPYSIKNNFTPQVEIVCLLSKLKTKQHIEAEIHTDELDRGKKSNRSMKDIRFN